MAKMSKLNDANNKKEKQDTKNSKVIKGGKNENKPDDKKLDENDPVSYNENENLTEEGNAIEVPLEEEIEKIKDQLLRTLAENENLRKRTSKDIEHARKYGHISFVRDLLSSVDNLTRAVNASPIDKEKLEEPIKNLIVGVEIVLNEINSFLDKNHIVKIEPMGEKFDYNFHQAMYEEPTDKVEAGIVTEVIQTGYLLHDRLVRPALVGISKKTEKKDD